MSTSRPETSMRALLARIDRLRKTRTLLVLTHKNGSTLLPDGPDTKRCGLYWLCTSYSSKAIAAAAPADLAGAVGIGARASSRSGLANICRQKADDFTLVYNGIGGLGPQGSGGLRERILGEFTGGHGTGSLAIRWPTLVARRSHQVAILVGKFTSRNIRRLRH